MKKYVYSLLFGAVSWVTTPYTLSAELININFGTSAPSAQLIGGSDTLTWNLVFETAESNFPNAGTFTSLSDSDGAGTMASFSWSDTNYSNVTASPFPVAYQPLMWNYAYSFEDETTTMQFSGLHAGIYDMYVYSQGDTDGEVLDMTVTTIAGTSLNKVTNESNDERSTFIENYNYLYFSNIAVGGDGAISMSFQGNSGEEGSRGVVNGIQLTAVPEPSTFLLLGFGSALLGTISFRRKCSADVQNAH